MEWTIPIKEDNALNLVGRTDGMELEIIANFRRVDDTIYLEGVQERWGKIAPSTIA